MQLDHGSRRTYAHGCRCTLCRAANAAYVAAQRQTPTGLTDAGPARAHLAALQRAGLGTRQLAALAPASRATIAAVLAGTVTTVRPDTAARLLAVRPVLALGAHVAGTKTHRFLDSLHREGFTGRELAFRLGSLAQQLQLHPRVTARTALRVAALYRHLAD